MNEIGEFLKANPVQCLATVGLDGKVVLTDDIEVKKAILETSDIVKSQYKTVEDPIFEAFYLEDGKATIADFSGNPPKTYNL